MSENRSKRNFFVQFITAVILTAGTDAAAGPPGPTSLPPLPKGFETASEDIFSAKDLEGKWTAPCRTYLHRSYEVDLELTTDRLIMIERTYEGRDCRKLAITEETVCSYVVDRVIRDNSNGKDLMIHMQLTPTVQDVFVTLHTEAVRQSGQFEMVSHRFKVGERKQVTGMTTASGADFSEGFPQRGETPETWTSLPAQFSIRLAGPHEPVQLNRPMGPSDEAGFVRPGAPPPIRPKSSIVFGGG